jgi:hypothetical protein
MRPKALSNDVYTYSFVSVCFTLFSFCSCVVVMLVDRLWQGWVSKLT